MCSGEGPTARQGAAGTRSTGKAGFGEQVLRRDEEVHKINKGVRRYIDVLGRYHSKWETLSGFGCIL